MDKQDFTVATGGFDARQLPQFEPDSGLWARIEAAQHAKQRRQRWRTGGLVAAAAMLAGVAVLLLPRPLPGVSRDSLAGQRESQVLESEWQKLSGNGRMAAVGTTQLRVIDEELQAAYDRGAAPDEVAPLWQERNQALRGLIAGFQSSGVRDVLAITRI
ncbi:MAG: hypothetical protein ABIS07_08005 [Dokdonella sp.]